ncbi:KAP family P-loop domain protein [Microbacterium laevaniformans]|uniref:KAP family P-loop domain protein n=1 Tax=Microbacterium laevaniformans TaxID=36807 RepID=A0A150HD36_9MICO|nr:KAP family P-loop domain protein [Microbacterium laevaniformans]
MGVVVGSDFRLWSDEPSATDLLSFDAIADTVVDALFDGELDPVALGLEGTWGSGKTTVLHLIEKRIDAANADDQVVIVVRSNPWQYDPTVGAKESLIAEILGALSAQFNATDPVGQAGLTALRALVRRVNWSKAVKMAARTTLTLQLPSLDDVFDLVSDDPESLDSPKGMASFKDEFQKLLTDPALAHVSRVVVLVDDLDRCLPPTVVETLETIRLFLSVPGMCFVVAADAARVAEAIRMHLGTPQVGDGRESVASLYLHKIVQTTVPVPALSSFDTRAYLFLLLARQECGSEAAFEELVRACGELRVAAGSLDDLALPEKPLQSAMQSAARLTPILYEKLQANPRRIKRFMNDLNVRQSIANRRGIALSPDAVAKLMVLERTLPADFDTLLSWLSAGVLRPRLERLAEVAESGSSGAGADAMDGGDEEAFSATMIRWAKLPPALDAATAGGYLTLAAAFRSPASKQRHRPVVVAWSDPSDGKQASLTPIRGVVDSESRVDTAPVSRGDGDGPSRRRRGSGEATGCDRAT